MGWPSGRQIKYASNSATPHQPKNSMSGPAGVHTRAGNSEQAAATQAGSKDIRGAGISNPGKNAATAYRHLAAIARVSDPARARDYCTQAVRLDPSKSRPSTARAGFQWRPANSRRPTRPIAAWSMRRHQEPTTWSSYGRIRLGNIRQLRDRLDDALANFVRRQSIAERRAKASASDLSWERYLAAARNKIGDIFSAMGNLPEALNLYQAGLLSVERVAKANASDAGLQRDLRLRMIASAISWSRRGSGGRP